MMSIPEFAIIFSVIVLVVVVVCKCIAAAAEKSNIKMMLCCIVGGILLAMSVVGGFAERQCPDDVRTCWIIYFDLAHATVWVVDEDGFWLPVPFARDDYQLGEERTIWVYENIPNWLEPNIEQE